MNSFFNDFLLPKKLQKQTKNYRKSWPLNCGEIDTWTTMAATVVDFPVPGGPCKENFRKQ